MITSRQIRAARAMLDWSQDGLAASSGLSLTTIRGIEAGNISPRKNTLDMIQQILEGAGIEFCENGGIKPRNNEVEIIRGHNSCDALFDDMLKTAQERGGEVIGVFKSQEILTQSCNITSGNLKWLNLLSSLTKVKCLVSDNGASASLLPPFDIRFTSKQQIGAVSYFVYGNKYVIILPEGNHSFRFIIHNSISLAAAYRNHFILVWDHAIAVQKPAQERVG